MSFYINNTNQNRPGPINGNGVNGICEKILIETTKVFDACRCTTTEPGLLLPVTGFSPANPTLPLTYVSAETTVGVDPTVSDLVIDRLDTCPNYANVSFSVEIPITVTYRDANGGAWHCHNHCDCDKISCFVCSTTGSFASKYQCQCIV